MAASKLAEAVEDEISCPICFEDFEEPKCLPNCAHNVCQHCLEGMVKKKKKTIKCPVCRVESVIPNGGVASFPKNHLLVRLIERTPGRKEKKSMKQALENCKTKTDGAKRDLKEMEDSFAAAKIQAEKIKQKIKSLAENVVLMVREQEQKILGEIDVKFSQNMEVFATHKLNTLKLCGDASSCMETVQEVLQNAETRDLKDFSGALVKKLNDFSKSLDTRMFWANSEFKQSFDISLTDTASVEKFIEDECSLGKFNTGQATAVTARLIEYSMSGSMIQTVDGSFGGISKFSPFSVAVSRITGHFVVLDLDEEMKYVHIFMDNGEPFNKFCITCGDPWDLAVTSDNEIVVLDRGSNRLLHYNMNGNIKVKKASVSSSARNLKFSSLSIDIHERFIISSCPCFNETKADTLPCILVYSPLGVLMLSFGKKVLSSPEKAVSFNDKFFVADSGRKSVVVFDKFGNFFKEIGKSQLNIPSSIAADYTTGQFLVSDSGNSTVQIYSQAGDLLLRFQTEHAPVGVAVTKDYDHLLICF